LEEKKRRRIRRINVDKFCGGNEKIDKEIQNG
jgi:hypothetical protein